MIPFDGQPLIRENFAVLIDIPELNLNGSISSLSFQAISMTDLNNIGNFSEVDVASSGNTSNNMANVLASVSVSSMLFGILQANANQSNETLRVISVFYEPNSNLFQDRNVGGTGGVIFSFSTANGAPPSNLGEPVEFLFQTNQVCKTHCMLNMLA